MSLRPAAAPSDPCRIRSPSGISPTRGAEKSRLPQQEVTIARLGVSSRPHCQGNTDPSAKQGADFATTPFHRRPACDKIHVRECREAARPSKLMHPPVDYLFAGILLVLTIGLATTMVI